MLAHLSDLHIGATDGGDPARDLADAVTRLLDLSVRIDAVLVTGDLAEHGAPAEYALVRTLLEPLGAPVLPVPGNHDDRTELRAAFPELGELSVAPGGPVRYAVRCGDLRLLACDTPLAGRADGALGEEQLGWLAATLAYDPRLPTVLAMHHPPIATGMPGLDAIGLRAADTAALRAVLDHHPQVRRVLCGHAHLTALRTLGGCPVLVCPSTWRTRARLRLGRDGLELESGPAGVALHLVVAGDLTSHVQPLDPNPAA